MLPPRIVYSAWIENKSPYPVKVRVQYKMPNGSLESRLLEISPNGGRTRAEERTVTEGYATFAASIDQVTIESVLGGGKPNNRHSMLAAPFMVSGPTRDYVFIIGKDLTLMQRRL